MKRGTVAVGYCHPGVVSGWWASSMIQLVGQTGRVHAQHGVMSGPQIHKARNLITEQFLAGDLEWLWMVDCDMVFPPDTVDRLLDRAHWKDRPIVGALCWGTDPAGLSRFPTTYKVTEAGIARFVPDPLKGMVEVDATGAACLLIHRGVLEKIGAEYSDPWRWFAYSVYGGQNVGEDVTFCLRARALGYPIWVDADLETGHVKTHVIGWRPQV